MITLDASHRDILLLLINEQEPLSARAIAKQTELTPRMVRYRLSRVERWLGARNVALSRRPRYGYLIEASEQVRRSLGESIRLSKEREVVLSRSERVDAIILWLLSSGQDVPVSAKQIMHEVSVSRSTVLKDLHLVEEWLSDYHLFLQRRPNVGIQVRGKEEDGRRALVSLLLETVDPDRLLELCTSPMPRPRIATASGYLRRAERFLLHDLDLVFAAQLICESERSGMVQLADTSRVTLTLYLAIATYRLSQGKSVALEENILDPLLAQGRSDVARAIMEKVAARLGISISPSEVAQLTAYAIGTRVQRRLVAERETADKPRAAPETVVLVERLVEEASQYLDSRIRYDRKLIAGLAAHLELALRRLRFEVPTHNPLLEETRRVYPYIFSIASKVSHQLEEATGTTIPEAEVAYIAMYLGSAIERLRFTLRKRVLVACASGMATAWMLVSRLQNEIPELEIVEICSLYELRQLTRTDIDAVISTVAVRATGIPVIRVAPFLSLEDIVKVRQALHLGPVPVFPGGGSRVGANEKQGQLATLLSPDTVAVGVAATNWLEAVDRAGRLLLDVDAVEPRYLPAMKELLRGLGPYMVIAPGIALLHARPEDGAKRPCVGLITLDTPVSFGHPEHDPVRIAFVLSTTDDHAHLRALAQLMSILRDSSLMAALAKAETDEQAYNLLVEREKAVSNTGTGW